MSFSDVFKKSFLEELNNSTVDSKTLIIILIWTAILGLYVYFVYRLFVDKPMYSKEFNISTVGVSLITAVIIATIRSSIVVSLGMVGALSIVRFRTAIKDPIDLMFLYWSISNGIVCGAGFIYYAIILAVICSAMLIILNRIPLIKAPVVLVVAYSGDKEKDIIDIIKKHSSKYKIRSRAIVDNKSNMTVEMQIRSDGGGVDTRGFFY